jgi:hypothetical protein
MLLHVRPLASLSQSAQLLVFSVVVFISSFLGAPPSLSAATVVNPGPPMRDLKPVGLMSSTPRNPGSEPEHGRGCDRRRHAGPGIVNRTPASVSSSMSLRSSSISSSSPPPPYRSS